MVVELYNATKPGSARRALISSILLLGLAGILAARMSWTRTREPLAVRIEPTGWQISFRPPKRFTPGPLVNTQFGVLIPLHGRTATGADARLAVVRLDLSGADNPSTVSAELALGFAFLQPFDVQPSIPQSVRAPLGPFAGMETLVEPLSTVARVAKASDAVGYAVALSVDGEPIDEDLYHLFDLTCRSIRHAEP